MRNEDEKWVSLPIVFGLIWPQGPLPYQSELDNLPLSRPSFGYRAFYQLLLHSNDPPLSSLLPIPFSSHWRYLLIVFTIIDCKSLAHFLYSAPVRAQVQSCTVAMQTDNGIS